MNDNDIAEIVLSDVSLLTCDRVNALGAGHGGLTLAWLNAANRVVEALLAGQDGRLRNENASKLPLDDIVKTAVQAALAVGATPSNAALIAALLLYFAGTSARAGVPAGNRKLGALARLHARAERGGVASIPTPKLGNKISGFPAVHALYDAMARKQLTRVDGGLLPMCGVGTPWGHSALGEDIIIPQVAINGARIATRAMKRAYEGAGILPSPIICAIFGAAAVAEVIHPDAAVAEKYGPYSDTDSIYLVGSGAVREAGLVPHLHILGSDRVLDTARVVGDLGLILKDIGSPTVVGMIGFNDLLAGLTESDRIMPVPIGIVNPPLVHVPTPMLLAAMELILSSKGNTALAAERLAALRESRTLDAETAFVSMYIMARKGSELEPGPVTDAFLAASQGPTRQAVARRVRFTNERLEAEGGLAEAVRALDDQRKAMVEEQVGRVFSAASGRTISVRLTQVRPNARRSDPLSKKYLGLDAYFDAEVTANRRKHVVKDVFASALPRAMRGGLNRWLRYAVAIMVRWLVRIRLIRSVQPGQEWMIPHMLDIPLSVALGVGMELTYASSCILNVVAPVAVAVAKGKHSPADAAKIAESAAYLSAGIPGAKSRAAKLGEKIAAAKG